jgi:hypothetical protein
MTRRHVWLVAFWLGVLAGTVVSLLPGPQLPDPWFPGADKLQHAIAYAVLFIVGRRAGYRTTWGLPLGLLALGVVIELAQGAFTETRSAEWLDGVADAAGIGLGHLITTWLERQRAAASTRLEQKHGR